MSPQGDETEIFSDRRAHTLDQSRRKLPWPADRSFKILSLDGGGIRGVFTASLLARVENEITKGQPIGAYFDLIAGTSTGGILAIAAGLEIPAARMEELYLNEGKIIFPTPKGLWAWVPGRWRWLRRLRQYGYEPRALENILKHSFGNKELGDSSARLIIPAFKVAKPEITVLKTDHHSDYKHDWKVKAWQAARATSDAQTYLPGFISGQNVYLDGGVWANNPIMLAIVEALSAFQVTRGQIEVLSIGTGNIAQHINILTAKHGGLIAWREIIHTAVFLTSDNADGQAGLLLGPEKILRIDPAQEAEGIELDDWQNAVAKLPSAAERLFGEYRPTLERFFLEKVAPRDRYYSTVRA